MKIIIFLFISIFVYVDADVYTIKIEDLTPQDEKVLSIENPDNEDSSNDNKTCLYNLIIRESIPDSPAYDGYGFYVDTTVKKPVQLCNIDNTDVSGTMSSILLEALGLLNDDEIACPIEVQDTCVKSEFKMVAGNFEAVFSDGTDEAKLEIHLPALIRAKFSISRKEGLPVPESVPDSSVEEEREIKEAIEKETAAEQEGEAAAGEEGEAAAGEEEAGEDPAADDGK